MNKINWGKAPEWATCVVKTKDERLLRWAESYSDGSKIVTMDGAFVSELVNTKYWAVVEWRPAPSEGFHKGGYVKGPLEVVIDTERLIEKINYDRLQQCMKAPDLLNQAAQLLAERGQQYDKEGEERSAAAIVAAFNAVTKRDLTPGEGWLFMVLLKAVRFYSNTKKPHRDSLEDMIAYTALHAEEYLRK